MVCGIRWRKNKIKQLNVIKVNWLMSRQLYSLTRCYTWITCRCLTLASSFHCRCNNLETARGNIVHSWLLILATLSARVKKQFGAELGAILIMDGAWSHYSVSVEAEDCQVGSSGWLLWRERRHQLRTLSTDTVVGAVCSSSGIRCFSPRTQML